MEAQQTIIFVHYTALALFALVLSLGFSAFSPMEVRVKRAYLTVALGVLAFMTMFRASTVGNDTQEYILTYLSVDRTPDITAYIASSVIFDGVLGVLMRLFPKYQYYLGGRTVDGETRLATVLNIAVYSLMFFVPKLFNPAKGVLAAREETAFRRLSALNILVLIVSTNATILTRFTGLFTLFSVWEYSTSVSRLPRRERVVTVLLSVALLYAYGLVIAILRTPEWFTTYPFAFCWM